MHTNPIELATRLRQVEQRNVELASALETVGAENRDARDELTAAQDELTAAQENLRRMIRGQTNQ